MKAKPFFDEAQFNGNLDCLRQLQTSANELALYWGKLIKTPLTGEIYAEWISDKNLIYETYRRQALETMPPEHFDHLPEHVRRPLLDDHPPTEPRILQANPAMAARLNQQRKVYTPGRFDRIFERAYQYIRPHDYEILIFVDVGYLTWIDGKATITEATQKEMRQRCIYTPDEKESAMIEALHGFLAAFGNLQGTGISKLPIKQDGSVNYPELFSMTRSTLQS